MVQEKSTRFSELQKIEMDFSQSGLERINARSKFGMGWKEICEREGIQVILPDGVDAGEEEFGEKTAAGKAAKEDEVSERGGGAG